MKKFITLSILFITFSIQAQWSFNANLTGIETTSCFATGNYSIAMGNQTKAINFAAIAMGFGSTASGSRSTAMGSYTIASGDYSTTMGNQTIASGELSTAMGDETIAEGSFSTAMGRRTKASDYGSLVMGQHNLLGSTVTSSATQPSGTNTAFVIGNGANESDKSDAFSVLFDGTTNVAGSITATSFIGDGSLLTNLPTSIWTLDSNGTGLYSPTNTATGNYSIAMGNNTTASDFGSTAMGFGSTASGSRSTAMGSYTIASGDYSTTMGNQTIASGELSTAMGDETIAEGSFSTAMGRRTKASDYGSLVMGQHNLLGSTVTSSATQPSGTNTAFVIGNGANESDKSDAFSVLFDGTTNVAGSITATSFIGDGSLLTNLPTSIWTLDSNGTGLYSPTNTATGNYSTAMGKNTVASGNISTAIGFETNAIGNRSIAMGSKTTASGNLSTVIGRQTIASDYGSLVTGQYNLLGSTVTTSATKAAGSNTAFVIGNGVSKKRSDAFSVLFDGTTTIAGNVTAISFIGDGSKLTNLPNTGKSSQNVSGSVLEGTTLTIGIEGGSSEDVDLAPLLTDLLAINNAQQAQINAQQVLIEGLITRMEILEDFVSGSSKGNIKENKQLEVPHLFQNIPNPVNSGTRIGYFIPLTHSSATIIVSKITGQRIQNIPITKFGKGVVNINKDRLTAAVYFYSLYVDGKKVDTKKMIVE